MNLGSLAKVLKCAGNDDAVTLRGDPDADSVNIMFESKDGDKVSDFQLRLLDIDQELMGVPEIEYCPLRSSVHGGATADTSTTRVRFGAFSSSSSIVERGRC